MASRIVLLVSGIAFLVGGVLALLNPFAATLAAEQLAGWVFLLGGIVQLVPVFRKGTWSSRLWAGLLAVASIWLGLSLLGNPLAGVLTLTFIAAAMFLASGVAKIGVSFRFRGTPYFWPVLITGAVSVALAIFVFFNFAEAATTLLGLMLALELIASGVTLVIMAGILKGSEQAAET